MPELSLENYLSQSISQANWRSIGFNKRAGVLVPLFTTYSKNSFGIGDLGDLKLVIDWAKLIGNSIIQLLPMNEVGALFCPYDAISSFALEPSYICLKDFRQISKKKFTSKSFEHNYVDYAVKEEKLRLLWEVYLAEDLSPATDGLTALTINPVQSRGIDFESFQLDNFYWLEDFVLFKVLKKHHQDRAWYDWEDKFKNRLPKALQDFKQENIEEITFQMWLQWILFKQFRDVQNYAAKNNILIKGDLPVLVCADSADVWSHPGFFKLDSAAGAPPDMYAALGQRWGMPTYNWENIASDGYRYIKEKLKYAQEFYNILRIDHVVGLFRIWSIPHDDAQKNQGLNGKFDPEQEYLWNDHGRKILEVLIKNTKMLLCAEDLGVIPQCCTDTLQEFGIPGNDVARWVKDWNNRHDFLLPQEYRQLAVAMLSTHDTTNWKAWWQYEAGTVDQNLFMRKCNDRKINFEQVVQKLFDKNLSFYGRLRWKNEINSVDKLLWELGKNREEVGDFIELYKNTYGEKEKLWKLLGCVGVITEAASAKLLIRMIQFVLSTPAIFCINSIRDYLSMADIFKGDPYQYRINVPGTISAKNWSLRLPLSLEEMLTHPLNPQIRKMIADAGRI